MYVYINPQLLVEGREMTARCSRQASFGMRGPCDPFRNHSQAIPFGSQKLDAPTDGEPSRPLNLQPPPGIPWEPKKNFFSKKKFL